MGQQRSCEQRLGGYRLLYNAQVIFRVSKSCKVCDVVEEVLESTQGAAQAGKRKPNGNLLRSKWQIDIKLRQHVNYKSRDRTVTGELEQERCDSWLPSRALDC